MTLLLVSVDVKHPVLGYVRRSVGSSVRRFVGPSVRQSVGSSVRRFVGPSVGWSVTCLLFGLLGTTNAVHVYGLVPFLYFSSFFILLFFVFLFFSSILSSNVPLLSQPLVSCHLTKSITSAEKRNTRIKPSPYDQKSLLWKIRIKPFPYDQKSLLLK